MKPDYDHVFGYHCAGHRMAISTRPKLNGLLVASTDSDTDEQRSRGLDWIQETMERIRVENGGYG